MNNRIKECIVIGGGNSLQKAFSFGLQQRLSDKCVIACNYGFRHFPSTILTFVDRDFYKTRDLKKNPDIYEELKKQSLIVGINHSGISEFQLPNTILVKSSSILKEIKSPNEGFYTKHFLTGIFSMSLACYLMDYSGTIYLLGFDWTKEGNTHYYNKEEINHRGIGYNNCYRNHNPTNAFSPFEQFKNIKIFNVSPESGIDSFEKIDYETMIEKINKEKYSQEELREEIRRKLCIK